ncbi:MAG: hypothetical protein IKY52_09330 [Clostridia bacterium]|nr:hypothetical protein [Clostridia bacterium]
MYSRNTDRGGRRIKLPPGYDGSTFRHDTGELRRLAEETEMKIHSPVDAEEETFRPERREKQEHIVVPMPPEQPAPAEEEEGEVLPPVPVKKEDSCSFLEGLMGALGQEEWLLFLLILLLVADGSDCWDIILLLGLLLAVHCPDSVSH